MLVKRDLKKNQHLHIHVSSEITVKAEAVAPIARTEHKWFEEIIRRKEVSSSINSVEIQLKKWNTSELHLK